MRKRNTPKTTSHDYTAKDDKSLELVGFIDKTKQRECLRCDRLFLSSGPQNRLCERCCNTTHDILGR